jgi:NAD(P)-dependent dehydrogenase (short-subunit alcohol dehydrogenase family)
MTTTLVTGATRGLGYETARRLVQEGHTVFLGARDLERGAQAAAGIGGTALQLDVTDDASVRAAAASLRDEVGHLDVLVNNAGIAGAQRPPAEATIDDLRLVLDTNVVGAASVLSAFTPLLEASESPVVLNVSSAVGSLTLNAQPDARWSLLAYPMSKAALNMLTIQYARAFPRWRVNAATPGATATGFGPSKGTVGHPVEEGAKVLVRMATIGADGPTGTFVGADGTLPW